uniref:Uncharacterized protein n=1 Tax=Arundo donax TaxID=35708 RepID=A0A0A8YEI2_ARUDO
MYKKTARGSQECRATREARTKNGSSSSALTSNRNRCRCNARSDQCLISLPLRILRPPQSP